MIRSGHLKCYYFTDQSNYAPVGFMLLKYTKELMKVLISELLRASD